MDGPCGDGRVDAHASVGQLILQARAGDTAAFTRLYDLHIQHVRRYARQVAHADTVEDLVAEAFTRTWAQLRAGAGPDRFFAAYIRAAVLHLHLRQRRRDRHLEWVPDLEADAEVRPVPRSSSSPTGHRHPTSAPAPPPRPIPGSTRLATAQSRY